MRLTRRGWLVGWGAVPLACSLPAAAQEYVEDPRTARALGLTLSRQSLGTALRKMGAEVGVPLSAGLTLQGESLVGHLPRRPLREVMRALEELFDAGWTRLPTGGYRLEPGQDRAALQERTAFLRKARHYLDGLSLAAAKQLPRGNRPPEDEAVLRELLPLLFWARLSSDQRDAVLQGKTVQVSVPADQAELEHAVVVGITHMPRRPLAGPMLATFDLDDGFAGQGVPRIRCRATAYSGVAITGAIDDLDFVRPDREGEEPAPEGGAPLPSTVGTGRRISGSRDDVVLELGRQASLPILSRHRASAEPLGPVEAAGRPVLAVVAEVAQICGARARTNSRGFHLLRSLTEVSDFLCRPDGEALAAYQKVRPDPGTPVPADRLMLLAANSPFQLQMLARSEEFGVEARCALRIFAALRLLAAATPNQRTALFSDEGLEASALTHRQLHAFLDERDNKRAGFEIHSHLQRIGGLRFRFRQILHAPEGADPVLLMEAIREDTVVSSATSALPRVPIPGDTPPPQ